jgi:hypothetical protein
MTPVDTVEDTEGDDAGLGLHAPTLRTIPLGGDTV